jgi:hypothetical protein
MLEATSRQVTGQQNKAQNGDIWSHRDSLRETLRTGRLRGGGNTTPATSAAETGKLLWLATTNANTHRALLVLPNHSLKLTRYGMRCLAAPGQVCYFPSAAKQRIPPRSA